MKTYKISDNQRENLFNKWMEFDTKTRIRLDAHFMFQNGHEMPAEELNEWYKTTTQQIKEAEKEFAKTIQAMIKLRDQTVEIIKEGNENPFG